MVTFTDLNGFQVELFFEKGHLDIISRHVLVLVQYDGKWLCTIHKRRGVEFPGGKVETGETLEEAAIREVFEETGVVVSDLQWFAEYLVHDDMKFCKTVFTAKFVSQEDIAFDLETSGTVWLLEDELLSLPNLSFYMKDDGMLRMLEEVKNIERKW